MAKKKRDDDETQQASSGGSMAVNDAWTGMLAVSLLALMTASGFLLYDYLQYPDKIPSIPSITSKQPGTPAPVVPDPGKKEPEKKEPEKKE